VTEGINSTLTPWINSKGLMQIQVVRKDSLRPDRRYFLFRIRTQAHHDATPPADKWVQCLMQAIPVGLTDEKEFARSCCRLIAAVYGHPYVGYFLWTT